jgi:very-short-patch-repair endonuclease
VNQPVYDLSGNLLGLADLLDPDAGLVTEFDGQQHRERAQHRADNVREERLEAAGLVVVRVDSSDFLRHRDEMRHRIRVAWKRGMSRDRSHDRWTLSELDP